MERPKLRLLASIVLVSAWLGAAMLVAGVVAPSAFAVLPTRALAGAIVGRVFPSVLWSGIAIGLAVAMLTWSLPHRVARSAGGLILAGACAAAQLVIAPRIAAIRLHIGGAIDTVSPFDPRRLAFGRLHALSIAWTAVGGLAALFTLILLVRVASSRAAP